VLPLLGVPGPAPDLEAPGREPVLGEVELERTEPEALAEDQSHTSMITHLAGKITHL
jgi:hypothetical protein